jgi:hypothetical protein
MYLENKMMTRRNNLDGQDDTNPHSSGLNSGCFDNIDMNYADASDIQYASELTARRRCPQHTASSLVPSSEREIHQSTTLPENLSCTYQSYRDSILTSSTNLTSYSSLIHSEDPTHNYCLSKEECDSRNEQDFAFHSIADFNNSAYSPSGTFSFSGRRSELENYSDTGRNTLGDWFQRPAKDFGLGISSSQPEEEIQSSRHTPTNMSPPVQTSERTGVSALTQAGNYFHKKINPPTSFKQVAASATRFTWFGTKAAGQLEKPPLVGPAEDEFLNMNIETVLFPSNPPDHVDQHAFDSLLANAENILRKLQSAYRQRALAMHELFAEKAIRQEELEQAQTRAESSKRQLNDISAQFLEQEKAIKKLTEELDLERKARIRDREELYHQKTKVRPPGPPWIIDSDNIQTPRHRMIKSSCSPTMTHDSGFESEGESSAESIFSTEPHGPLESPVSFVASSPTSPEPRMTPILTSLDTPCPKPAAIHSPGSDRLSPSRPSPYGRIVKGLSPLAHSLMGNNNTPSGCTNCHGIRAYEAWSVVGVLKEENKGLKRQISTLQSAVDDCLQILP